jgi:lantibiotic modifying enzyme
VRTETAPVAGALRAGTEALRWVADAAIPADGGATWPSTRMPGAPVSDDLYDGTAGVLLAFAQARLAGLSGWDEAARAAAGRLRYLAEDQGADPAPDIGLYTGLSGAAAALRIWATTGGGPADAAAADRMLARIGLIVATAPARGIADMIEGDAGVLVVLTRFGAGPARPPQPARPAAVALADRLVRAARWEDGEPDWPDGPDGPDSGDDPVSYPNFSHGAAGVGYALAAASGPLRRPDLLELAASAGRRLVRLGTRPDGTLAVPYRVPPRQPDSRPEFSYGWCHGPTGTMRLFALLDRLQPGQGWSEAVAAARLAVRFSGLPARLYPGFWDNIGQCCGTAGVGEMALDAFGDTSDPGWLAWADELAQDVLNRRIGDADGVRWSHTEHRARPPELPPAVGWMQGAAGIAGWLLRLVRAHRDGPDAPRIGWPDHP